MATLVIEGLDELRAWCGAEAARLDADVGEAIDDALRLVAAAADARAPRRTGALAASITPVREGLVGDVRVTARRRSRSYPGGYPYPVRIERLRPFLAPALADEAPRALERLEGVLNDIQQRWGGS